jgi:SAM-dependent methyltransferase
LYGDQPNLYFRRFIDSHKPGSLLLPAEGEGRNAVYAASKGWEVDAFDFSEAARNKALKMAEKKRVKINYEIRDLETYQADRKYDAIALVYVHLPPVLRKKFHQQIYQSLKPGGFLVLEAFAKEQIHNQSGGPGDITLLYDAPSICGDFPFLHVLSCGQKTVDLDEGPFHKGKAELLQLTGQKL